MRPAPDHIMNIAATLDRLVAMTLDGREPSFAALAQEAGLDPATDFVGADLTGIDFRDENLTGFCFRDADLTGTDFRRVTGLADDALDSALTYGAVGLPDAIESRQTDDFRIDPATAPTP